MSVRDGEYGLDQACWQGMPRGEAGQSSSSVDERGAGRESDIDLSDGGWSMHGDRRSHGLR